MPALLPRQGPGAQDHPPQPHTGGPGHPPGWGPWAAGWGRARSCGKHGGLGLHRGVLVWGIGAGTSPGRGDPPRGLWAPSPSPGDPHAGGLGRGWVSRGGPSPSWGALGGGRVTACGVPRGGCQGGLPGGPSPGVLRGGRGSVPQVLSGDPNPWGPGGTPILGGLVGGRGPVPGTAGGGPASAPTVLGGVQVAQGGGGAAPMGLARGGVPAPVGLGGVPNVAQGGLVPMGLVAWGGPPLAGLGGVPSVAQGGVPLPVGLVGALVVAH